MFLPKARASEYSRRQCPNVPQPRCIMSPWLNSRFRFIFFLCVPRPRVCLPPGIFCIRKEKTIANNEIYPPLKIRAERRLSFLKNIRNKENTRLIKYLVTVSIPSVALPSPRAHSYDYRKYTYLRSTHHRCKHLCKTAEARRVWGSDPDILWSPVVLDSSLLWYCSVAFHLVEGLFLL